MPLSNSFNYTVNKSQAIKDALIEAGVIADNQPVSNHMYEWMSRRLNLLMKQLQAKGLLLWRVKDITLILETGKVSYKLGDIVDNTCAEDVVVTAGPDYTVANNSYIAKPLRIHEAYYVQDTAAGAGANDIPITIIPRDEYFRLNTKLTSSYPINIYFRPDIDYSELKVWPVSNNDSSRIVMSASLPMDDLNTATDNFSVPDWWLEVIHLCLSYVAARGYSAPMDKLNILMRDKEMALAEAMTYNEEGTYTDILPDMTQR